MCNAIQAIESRARNKRLTPANAEKVLRSTLQEVLESMGAPSAHPPTIAKFLESWLSAIRKTTVKTTLDRCELVVRTFVRHLGARAQQPLSAISKADIEAYRDSLTVATNTSNLHLKILRWAFNRAVKAEFIEKNPAHLVDVLRVKRDERAKRPFTQAELRKLLAIASDDWKTAIMLGLYLGQRLQDLVNLQWSQVDLVNQSVTLTSRKTGRTQIIPLHPALMRHLETLPAGDDPVAYLCPSLAGKRSAALSNSFYVLMSTAGLVPKRDHHAKAGNDRAETRTTSQISFHALRHTATSLLKNAGVSDVVAEDIIGHDSKAIGREYTLISEDAKRSAILKMPDVTAGSREDGAK